MQTETDRFSLLAMVTVPCHARVPVEVNAKNITSQKQNDSGNYISQNVLHDS